MHKLVVIVLATLITVPLAAQVTNKSEVFAGYQYLHFGGTTTGGITLNGQDFNGWNGSVTYNFSKHVGAKADVGGSYATVNGISNHIYSFTGGPVVSVGTEHKANPFVEALFGVSRFGGPSIPLQGVNPSISRNGFTMMAGGGIDVRASKSLSLRLIQADWLYYHFSADSIGDPAITQRNNIRISIGIVYRFVPFS